MKGNWNHSKRAYGKEEKISIDIKGNKMRTCLRQKARSEQ